MVSLWRNFSPTNHPRMVKTSKRTGQLFLYKNISPSRKFTHRHDYEQCAGVATLQWVHTMGIVTDDPKSDPWQGDLPSSPADLIYTIAYHLSKGPYQWRMQGPTALGQSGGKYNQHRTMEIMYRPIRIKGIIFYIDRTQSWVNGQCHCTKTRAQRQQCTRLCTNLYLLFPTLAFMRCRWFIPPTGVLQ